MLPVPVSPNKRAKHAIMQHREKMSYQRQAWLSAVQQHKPTRDPPMKVRVEAVLFLCRLRDSDNATASMKNVLDCLKQKQTGDLRWREGIADLCGYFYDDAPEYLSLTVTQEKVKKRAEERLEVTIMHETS